MTREVIDVFCHWLPPKFSDRVKKTCPNIPYMWGRACAMPVMADMGARRELMSKFEGYRQIPCLASPALEALAGPDQTPDLARCANEEMAEIVRSDPEFYPGFVAALPMNNPQGLLEEAEYAVKHLGASGVQVFTHVNGSPLDKQEYLQVFELMASLGRPVWLHPSRGLNHPDYVTEEVSKFDLWWVLGWPQETSVAMCRLAFAGVFDHWPELKIITHHTGGTVPLLAGRLGPGLDLLGTRNPPDLSDAVKTDLRERPVDALKHFYADTATFGWRHAIECGMAFFGVDHLLFASDMPFDPEQGPGYIRETLRAIDEMNLSGEEKDKILSGNVRRLLNPSSLIVGQ